MMVRFDLIHRSVKRHSFLRLSLFILAIPVLSGCWGSPKSDLSSTFDFKAIAIDPTTPTTIYVGTDGGGVYRSTDGGASWAQMNQGLLDLKITALAIDWFTPSRIYAGTENGGIFASSNNGESWIFNQTLISNIRAIVIDRNFCPADSPPCRGVYVASQTSGVWLSTDGGITYTSFNGQRLSGSSAVTAMAIYPTTVPNPISRLYIGTEGGGFFYRGILPLDNDWTVPTPGLIANTKEEPVSLAVNPQVISELYVGTSGGGESNSTVGIYKTTDAGTTFNLSYNPNFKYTIYFVVPVIGPSTTDLTLYAGADTIVSSVDRGGSWCILSDLSDPQNACKKPLDILSPGLVAFAVADVTDTTVDHSTFYAALFNRQFIKTTDGGQTWTTLSLQ